MRQDYESNQSRLAWMLGGISLGALAMYLADPDRGRQRRAVAQETLRSAMSSTGDAIGVARRDLGSRMQGLREQAGSMLTRRKEQLDDQLLKARVYQQVSSIASQPGAIDIDVNHGCVTLSGRVPAHERQQLIDAARDVEGVSEVEDYLDTQEASASFLTGRGTGAYQVQEVLENIAGMSPRMRNLALVAGAAFGLYWLTQRTSRAGSTRESVVVNKTIHIDAPPERVYDVWSNYENFPRFMSNVLEVRDLGGGRSHWVVKGPAGSTVEWDAQLTDSRRGEVLAWESEPGSTVSNTGQVRFESEGSGTRVNLYLAYTPPAGSLGQALASMATTDPRRQLDEDLARMKSFIESGKTTREAAQPSQGSAATIH